MIKFATILSLLLAFNPLTYVSEVNDTQEKAWAAYKDKRYLVAIYRYEHLVEKLEVEDMNVYLNLAHSYYKVKKWPDAKNYYMKVAKSEDDLLASLAYHQLGMISESIYNKDSSIEDFQNALRYFKLAIKSNPKNLNARYNYELLRKKLEELRKKLPKNQQQKNNRKKTGNQKRKEGGDEKQQNSSDEGDGDKKEKRAVKEEAKDGKDKMDKEGKEGKKKGGEGDEKSKENKLRSDQLKAININQEKIKSIFEAMKNKEIHYLQQKRRRNKRGKKGYGKNKPDW